jgi:molybdopterin-guanine dinucleotide biosynthesis protein A
MPEHIEALGKNDRPLDCVVLAGGIPRPGDPLYALTHGGPRALIDMGGVTMLERVVVALHAARAVGEIVVAGLPGRPELAFKRPVTFLADRGGLVENALAGLQHHLARCPETRALLFCAADIPTLTGAIVEAFVNRCRPFDRGAYYPLVAQEQMERRFPASRRTYFHLREGRFAGGDMAIARPALAHERRELLDALAAGRKNPLRIARLAGLATLLRLWTGRLDLAGLRAAARGAIGEPVEVLVMPYAELAMDADRPEQVQMLRSEFAFDAAPQLK